MEATKGIGQREIKGATKDSFLFEKKLSSKKLEKSSMDVVAYIIGMV